MNLQERQQFWQQQVNTWQTTGLSGAAANKWWPILLEALYRPRTE